MEERLWERSGGRRQSVMDTSAMSALPPELEGGFSAAVHLAEAEDFAEAVVQLQKHGQSSKGFGHSHRHSTAAGTAAASLLPHLDPADAAALLGEDETSAAPPPGTPVPILKLLQEERLYRAAILARSDVFCAPRTAALGLIEYYHDKLRSLCVKCRSAVVCAIVNVGEHVAEVSDDAATNGKSLLPSSLRANRTRNKLLAPISSTTTTTTTTTRDLEKSLSHSKKQTTTKRDPAEVELTSEEARSTMILSSDLPHATVQPKCAWCTRCPYFLVPRTSIMPAVAKLHALVHPLAPPSQQQ